MCAEESRMFRLVEGNWRKACSNGWVKLVLDHYKVQRLRWVLLRAEESRILCLVAENWRNACLNGLS